MKRLACAGVPRRMRRALKEYGFDAVVAVPGAFGEAKGKLHAVCGFDGTNDKRLGALGLKRIGGRQRCIVLGVKKGVFHAVHAGGLRIVSLFKLANPNVECRHLSGGELQGLVLAEFLGRHGKNFARFSL
ncbi:MAG: hypothetical protein AABW54_05150 [Candidatus Micrarchaeota archaeon]